MVYYRWVIEMLSDIEIAQKTKMRKISSIAKKLGITKNYRGRTDLAITINNKSTCPYNRILIRKK